jgi:hypothetical protein
VPRCPWPSRLRRCRTIATSVAAVALAPLSATEFVHAQQADHVGRRPATALEVFAGNTLAGGLTAATQALLRGNDPFRAFGIGALGGAVHLAGKNLAVEPGAAYGWIGLALAATGTSVVANAGRGISPFQELSIPIAAARVRIVPRAPSKVKVAVNIFESLLLARGLTRVGLEVDWDRSLSSGALVFVTQQKRIIFEDTEVLGVAMGPLVVLSAFAGDESRVMRHELVHVHQHWFGQEVWGRPLEELLRPRILGLRRLPSWLELGVVVPSLISVERQLLGRRSLRRFTEAESDLLERR